MIYWICFLLAALPVALPLPLRAWARGSVRLRNHAEHLAHAEPGTRIHWLAGLLYVIVFCGCVIVVKRIDISGANLDGRGLTTIAYTGSRAILSFYVLGVCLTLGALLLRVWRISTPRRIPAGLPHWIICLFLGASTLGVIGTAIGLIGGLKLPVVLALIVPLVFLTPSEVKPAINPILTRIRAAVSRQDLLGLTLHSFLAWYLLVILAVSLLWKGLYPAYAEADVWNHYVHYFREVLQTGSVGPGENWGHFWDSKAAGLTHIVGVLSDEFSAQLVSWVLAVMTTFIVVDLLRSALRNTAWALFGASVFLVGVLADPSIGAFLRHHMSIAALVGFWVWSALQIQSSDPVLRKSAIATALVVAFYTGLYPTQIAPLFVAFVGFLLAVAILRRKDGSEVQPLAWLLLAIIAGMLIEFLINYAATGIASLVSVRLFWPLSDQGKFGAVIGDSGILYYLYANNDNRPSGGTWEWFFRLFRVLHFGPLLAGALAIAIVATLSRIREPNRAGTLRRPMPAAVAVAGAFLLVSFIPPFVFRNEALMRAYLFLNFLVPVLVLLILKPLTDTCAENPFKRIWVGGLMIASSLFIAWQGLAPHKQAIGASLSFASGMLSTAEALNLTADTFSEPERFAFLKKIRREIGADPRIFTLTYAPGPGDGFPRPGMMSEPTYSLGPDYLEMIFGPPDRAVQLLRGRGVDYFHFSQEGALFTGLAFSELFRAGHLDRYFKLAAREGGQLLLTWRSPDDVSPLPRDFVETLELRQRAVLTFPFEAHFFAELKSKVRSVLAGTGYIDPEKSAISREVEQKIAAELAEMVDRTLRSRMSPTMLLPENKSSVHSALEKLSGILANSLPARLQAHRKAILLEPESRRHFADELTNRLTRELVTAAQIEVMNACIPRFGRPYCEILTHRDERAPFGVIYKSRATVTNLLRLDFSDIGSK